MRGKAISGATAVLILAFFYLPWFSVSLDGRVLGLFSGYQLAVGAGDYALDGLNGRSIFFIVPLSAIVILLWVIVAHYKPAWQIFAATGEFAAAALGLFILVWQWLGNSGNGALAFSAELGFWLTLLCFVFVLVGAIRSFRDSQETLLGANDTGNPVELVKSEPEIIIASPLAAPILDSETKIESPPSSKIDEAQVEIATPSISVWLFIEDGVLAGSRFQIIPPVRIGRDEGNNIVIDDNSMSGYHAVVREQGGAFHIQDLNSTNGIYLENQTNHRWQRVPAATLVQDMRIKLGQTIFQVEIGDVSSA